MSSPVGGASVMATPPSAPAPPAARGALPSPAHCEGGAPERLAVEGVDRRLRLGVRRHLDEGEAPGAAGLAIGHDLDLLDLTPVLLEEGPKLVLIHLVREVPNVQSLSHSSSRFAPDGAPPPFRTNGLLACRCR